MLQELHIHNYAIIDSIEINFSSHLNIITGETGAGKSILMGALSLILGDRADTGVLMDKEKKCYIEGVFKLNSHAVKSYLTENELDEGEEILIRREINPRGKSRAFINDSPVTLNQLKQLSSLLVDLHQQFDTLDLNSNDFQREVVDALADNGQLLDEYRNFYKKYKKSLKELEELKEAQITANKELDYNQFLWDELNEAAFSEGEIEKTEADIKLMSHAENIKLTLTEIYAQLEENEEPVIQQLMSIQHKLQSLQSVYPETEELSKRLKSVTIELQDISAEIESSNSKIVYDAEQLELLNERMTLGYNLFKKHHVQTTLQLLEIKDALEKELEKVTNLTEAISQKEKESTHFYEESLKIAKNISQRRQKEIQPFEQKVNELLIQVGMINAQIKLSITEENELNLFGNNEIEFLFNANKSARFEPIRKVASGGELSRLMLIIKSLVAKKVQLPTLIFDEIDSGISGEAARQVSLIIQKLSKDHQLISITHQPQIAAKAHKHFQVYKDLLDDKVVTLIKTLNEEERVTTIATMLSGKKPTPAAFENAREMMNS
ncbi:MAG: DNA repair protein RecN [Ginsengibacter sp.]